MPAADDRPCEETRRAESGWQQSRILTSGEMLGQRYRMIDQIGAGSTGVVYRASDLAFDREVAVKVMSHASGEATALFLREARTTARLDHPSIVPIHDLVWLSGGGIAFAMKYIDGISLREALRRVADGDPPRCLATINDTLNVFLKLCDGIALAHDRGVVHCDIKPDNILVGQYGEVIILDWGEASSGDVVRDGSPVGTPAYMSPEQARGEPATPASDIWCIGATLFHCLLGRQPLVGTDLEPAEFWERKRAGAIEPRSPSEAARCDRRLLAILDKALAAQPDRRYASVRALADDLASFQGGQSVSAYRESAAERLLRWYRRNVRVIWLSVLLVASCAALVGVLWGSHLQRLASWGSPVFREDFAEGWQDRWRLPVAGSFDIGGSRAMSRLAGDGTLLLRREWPPHCAIEFTGESAAGGQEGDLSVYWLEGSAAIDGSWAASRSGWGFLFGAWDNTCSTLEKVGSGPVACDRGTVVQAGRKHRIRAEVDGDRVQLAIDGRTVFDHRDSFSAGSGRWMIYTWGSGKIVGDIAVYLRGSAELVPATSIPDSLRQRGLARDAAAEYRLIAESKAGSTLADQAWFKEGITWSEIGDWDGARTAWGRIRDTELAEIASILALQPMMDYQPARLFDEIGARWPAASASGRNALIRLWSMSARLFSNTRLALDDGLVDRHFALRRQLFPDALEADPVVALMARRTGRLRMAVDQVLNPCLRAELLIRLGDLKRVEREGTSGTRLQAQRRSQPTPHVAAVAADSAAPEWLLAAEAGELQATRARLLAADDMRSVTCLDRMLGDPRLTGDQPPIGPTLVNCYWLQALEQGDAAEAGRWERTAARIDADREYGSSWIQGMLEPVGIIAATGRRDEARRLAEAMRAEPATSWGGAAALWGSALCGGEVEVLPDIPHARELLAAMRAELAGDASAAVSWRAWFRSALPSYGTLPHSLLRLARWRGAAGQVPQR